MCQLKQVNYRSIREADNIRDCLLAEQLKSAKEHDKKHNWNAKNGWY